MSLSRALALFLLLFLTTPGWADPAVLFDCQLAVQLGDRRMVAQPRLKVASEQEASMVLVEEDESRVELSITPRVEGGLIRLAVKVLAISGDRRLQRTLQYTAVPGENSQFFDGDSDSALTLSLTPTLAE